MVGNIGVITPTNGKQCSYVMLCGVVKVFSVTFCVVEATAYISAVAAFAVVVLVVLLFLGRRWCYSAVFGRKCCDDILTVNAAVTSPGLPLDNAQFGQNCLILFFVFI